jgi:hypothetical protein
VEGVYDQDFVEHREYRIRLKRQWVKYDFWLELINVAIVGWYTVFGVLLPGNLFNGAFLSADGCLTNEWIGRWKGYENIIGFISFVRNRTFGNVQIEQNCAEWCLLGSRNKQLKKYYASFCPHY